MVAGPPLLDPAYDAARQYVLTGTQPVSGVEVLQLRGGDAKPVRKHTASVENRRGYLRVRLAFFGSFAVRFVLGPAIPDLAIAPIVRECVVPQPRQ
jgi:hypothetical protein